MPAMLCWVLLISPLLPFSPALSAARSRTVEMQSICYSSLHKPGRPAVEMQKGGRMQERRMQSPRRHSTHAEEKSASRGETK